MLRRLRLSLYGTTLQSDNPAYAAIPVPAGELAAEGIVTCSWRPRNALCR